MQRLVKLDATGLLPSTCKRFLSLGFNTLVSLAFIATTFISPTWAKSPQKQEIKAKIMPSKSSNYSLKGHIWNVSAIAFSADGQTLISGSFDQTIRIWDIKTRKIKATLNGHDGGVNAVAISPDSKILVSAGGAAQTDTDKNIKVWDLEKKSKKGKNIFPLLRSLAGHNQGITSLVFTPDGKTLISSSYDKTIQIWDVSSGKLLNTLTGHGNWVKSIAVTSDGRSLASGGGDLKDNTDNTIKIWDITTGKLKQILKGYNSQILYLAFTPDGKNLVSATESQINVWNSTTGKLVNTIKTSTIGGVNTIALNPNGQTVLTTSIDGSIQQWNLSTGKLERSLVNPPTNENVTENIDYPYPTSLGFTTDGKTLAIGYGGNADLSIFSIDVRGY
jgi:WD40 repeat protein